MRQIENHPSGESLTIAVAIPAFNAEQYIVQCLESVRVQTRAPDEIIVVDDGSTDRTPELLQKIGGGIKIIRTQNGGLAAARNMGFSSTRCRFVALLDADDFWPPNKLEVYDSYARRFADAGFFYSDLFCVGPEGVYRRVRSGYPGPTPFFRLLERNFVASSSVMVERDIWSRVGGVRGAFAHPAGVVDWDFFLKASKVKPFRYIPEPLLYYRVHGSSAMQTWQESLWKDSARVALRHSRNTPTKVRKAALASVFYQSGLRFLTAGFLQKARGHFFRGLRYSFCSFSGIALFLVSLAGQRAVSVLLIARRHFLRLIISPSVLADFSGNKRPASPVHRQP